jgi:hypothetical protein
VAILEHGYGGDVTSTSEATTTVAEDVLFIGTPRPNQGHRDAQRARETGEPIAKVFSCRTFHPCT